MSNNKERFYLKKTVGGAWMIHDKKDDSVVCVMNKGKRPLDKTEAMANVMIEALNKAVRPRDTVNANVCHKAGS